MKKSKITPKLKKGFIYSFLFFLCLQAISAQNIVVNPASDFPVEVIACGDEELFKFRVYGPTLANEKVSVQLPSESEYIALSAPTSGVTVNSTDRTNPIFNIVSPLTGPSDYKDVYYTVKTGCTIVADPEISHTLVSNNAISNTFDFPPVQYSVLEVSPNVVPASASLNVNQSQNFTFTVGNDPVSSSAYTTEVYTYITHSTNVAISYSGTGTFTPGTPSGGMVTDVLILGLNEIQAIGDNDSRFEKNESIAATISATLLSCPSGAGETISYRAGYGGCLSSATQCITGNTSTSGIDLATGAPNLFTSAIKKAWPSPSNTDTAQFLLRNDGTGSGDIYNLTFELGFSNGWQVFIPSHYPIFTWSNFSVNGQPVANSGAQGSFTDFQFSSDPDGPGVGLEDLDGDGFYDDLPVGHSFVLTNELAYNYLVDTNGGTPCDEMYRGYATVRWRYGYENQCGNNTTLNVPNISLGTWRPWSFYSQQHVGTNVNSSSGNSNLSPGDTFVFYIDSRGTPSISNNNIPGLHWEVYYTLPNGIVPNGNGTWGGQPFNLVSFDPATGLAIYSSVSASNGYSIGYDPRIPLRVDPSCSSSYVGSIHYEYHLKGDPTYEPIDLCGDGATFTVTCPGGSPSVCVTDFSFDRTTMGYTDNSETTRVSPTAPGIRLDHAIQGDMVRWHAEIDVNENNILALDALLEYDANDWFGTQGDGGIKAINIEYQPSGGGSSVISNDLSLYNYTANNGGKTNHTVNLKGGPFAALPIGVGDKFIVDVDLKFSESPTFTDNYFETISGILMSAPTRSVGNPTTHVCNYMTDDFGALRFYNIRTTMTNQSITIDDCSSINIGARVHFSSYSKIGYLFPNEFRNFHWPKRFDILVPVGVDYVPGSSVYKAYPNQFSYNLPDPVITYNYEPGFHRYSWVNTGNWPKGRATVSWGIDDLYFDVIPNCKVEDWSYPGNRFGITILPTTEIETFRNLPSPKIVSPPKSDRPRSTQYIPLSYTVSSPIPTVSTAINSAAWTLNINNTSSGGTLLDNTWLAIEVPNNNLVPTLWEGATQIPLTSYSAGKYWAKLGSLNSSGKQLEIRSDDFTICGSDNFNVRVGQNCAGYPTNPDTGYPLGTSDNYTCNEKSVTLTLNTQEPSINVTTILGNPPATYDFCTAVPYTIDVNNAANGYAFAIVSEIRLPQGMNLQNTTGILSYNGSNYNVPAGLVSHNAATNTYTIDISGITSPIGGTNGLPGVSAADPNFFSLSFDTRFDCDYVSGSKLRTLVRAESACGQPTNPNQGQSEIKTNPVNVTQVPANIQYVMNVSSDDQALAACGQTETISVNIINQGVDTDANIETIVATIDESFNYVSGSYVAGTNGPVAAPSVNVNGVTGQRELTWAMPDNIPSGSNISFTFAVEVVTPSDVSCRTYDLNVSTRVQQSIDCSSGGGVTCPTVNSITSQADESLTVQKSSINISSTTVNSNENGGNLDITAGFSLENTSTLSVPSGTEVSAFDDTNNNGVFDEGTDTFIASTIVNNVIPPGNTIDDTINFTVNNARGCNVLLVVNANNNECICDHASTELQCNADLSLTKIIDNANPVQGQDVTFTITVTNDGNSEPTNVVVRDVIPADFTYNHPNFSTTQGNVTFNVGTRQLEWNLGAYNIPIGSSISLSYTVTVDNCGSFVNQAEIINSSLSDPDSTPASGN